MYKATAVACSNIAFVKYWGKRDESLRLPSNPSLSMALDQAATTTTVAFQPELTEDEVSINGQLAVDFVYNRVTRHLDCIRRMAGISLGARVASSNSFPSDAGIASSASGFAALTVAAVSALDMDLSKRELSCLARLGSGSATRSIPGGFSEWYSGCGHETSYSDQIVPPEHWPELRDIVAVLDKTPKVVSSTQGMALAQTSVHMATRLSRIPERLARARQAIIDRDLTSLGEVSEEEAIELHIITLSSYPPIFYWKPATLMLIHRVLSWRSEGLEVYFTVDAGPNVHLLCKKDEARHIVAALDKMPEVKHVIENAPGPAAQLYSTHLF